MLLQQKMKTHLPDLASEGTTKLNHHLTNNKNITIDVIKLYTMFQEENTIKKKM